MSSSNDGGLAFLGFRGEWRRVIHLFAELTVIRVLDFVEVVLVELSDETSKVGVLEYPR
jgi:hypothetical protein